MLGAEAQYCRMEQELQSYLDNYEGTHDYDEYHFDLADIEHDPYVPVSYTHLSRCPDLLSGEGTSRLVYGGNADGGDHAPVHFLRTL